MTTTAVAAPRATEPAAAKAPANTYICAGCGYGICVTSPHGLPRCPMCRIQSWRPDRAKLVRHLC
jgi:hypothetical protein